MSIPSSFENFFKYGDAVEKSADGKNFYAMRDGKPIHISQLREDEFGKSCYCTCLFCGEPVVMRRKHSRVSVLGNPFDVNAHFSHIGTVGENHAASERRVYETKLHLCAKEVIAELGGCWVPTMNRFHSSLFNLPEDVEEEMLYFDIGEEFRKVFPGEFVKGTVRLEHHLDSMVPDVILTTENGQKYLIEVEVFNSVSSDKRQKLKDGDYTCFEFRFRKLWRKVLERFRETHQEGSLECVIPDECFYDFLKTLFQYGPEKVTTEMVEKFGIDYFNSDETCHWISVGKDFQDFIIKNCKALAKAIRVKRAEREAEIQALLKKKEEEYQKELAIEQEKKAKEDVRRENLRQLFQETPERRAQIDDEFSKYRSSLRSHSLFKAYPFLLNYIDCPIDNDYIFSVTRDYWQSLMLIKLIKQFTKSIDDIKIFDFLSRENLWEIYNEIGKEYQLHPSDMALINQKNIYSMAYKTLYSYLVYLIYPARIIEFCGENKKFLRPTSFLFESMNEVRENQIQALASLPVSEPMDEKFDDIKKYFRKSGFEDFLFLVGLPMPGDFVIGLDSRIWQSRILIQLLRGKSIKMDSYGPNKIIDDEDVLIDDSWVIKNHVSYFPLKLFNFTFPFKGNLNIPLPVFCMEMYYHFLCTLGVSAAMSRDELDYVRFAIEYASEIHEDAESFYCLACTDLNYKDNPFLYNNIMYRDEHNRIKLLREKEADNILRLQDEEAYNTLSQKRELTTSLLQILEYRMRQIRHEQKLRKQKKAIIERINHNVELHFARIKAEEEKKQRALIEKTCARHARRHPSLKSRVTTCHIEADLLCYRDNRTWRKFRRLFSDLDVNVGGAYTPFIGIPISGDELIGMDRRIWQSVVLYTVMNFLKTNGGVCYFNLDDIAAADSFEEFFLVTYNFSLDLSQLSNSKVSNKNFFDVILKYIKVLAVLFNNPNFSTVQYKNNLLIENIFFDQPGTKFFEQATRKANELLYELHKRSIPLWSSEACRFVESRMNL